MLGRFYRNLVTLATVPALAGGCVQATRHSNAMVFGTNTSFGVKVGTDVSEVPTILVGYDRQEAVILPLVANTRYHSKADGSAGAERLEPCDLTTPVTVTGGSFAVHPCAMVAVNGKAMDSYSVLASFGAQYDAAGSGVKGGLAQYFATGMAAQLLATTGGASVVATGDAAKASAVKAPSAEEAVKALYGNDTAFQAGVAAGNKFNDFLSRLQAKMTLTDLAQLVAKVQAFEAAAVAPIRISAICTDLETCKASARDAYALAYKNDPDKFETALTGW